MITTMNPHPVNIKYPHLSELSPFFPHSKIPGVRHYPFIWGPGAGMSNKWELAAWLRYTSIGISYHVQDKDDNHEKRELKSLSGKINDNEENLDNGRNLDSNSTLIYLRERVVRIFGCAGSRNRNPPV
jgi:hypothetical protein